MFWHVILVLFAPLYLVFALLFRDDRARLAVPLHKGLPVRMKRRHFAEVRVTALRLAA